MSRHLVAHRHHHSDMGTDTQLKKKKLMTNSRQLIRSLVIQHLVQMSAVVEFGVEQRNVVKFRNIT